MNLDALHSRRILPLRCAGSTDIIYKPLETFLIVRVQRALNWVGQRDSDESDYSSYCNFKCKGL